MPLTQTTSQTSEALTEPRLAANRSWLRRLSRNRLALTGFVILVLASVIAVLAPVLAPYSPYEIHAVDRLQGPSKTYFLGTDHLGRDVFSRLIFGSRISLGVGAATVLLCNIAGILVGAISGDKRRVDNCSCGSWMPSWPSPGSSWPWVSMAIRGSSVTNVVIALKIVYIPRMDRVV